MPALSIAVTPARSTTRCLVAAANELAKLAFERFRRAAGQQRLARRQQQTIADSLCLTRNGHARY